MNTDKPSTPANPITPHDEASANFDGAGSPLSWTALDEARLCLYHVLSLAASDPTSQRAGRLRDSDLVKQGEAAAAFIAAEPSAQAIALAPGELPPAFLARLDFVQDFGRSQSELVANYERVFGLVMSKECPPYESEYCRQTLSVYRSHHLADVAGCYRAFGLEVSPDRTERHDHVALELEFMAWLLAKQRHALQRGGPQAFEQARVCREAQRLFVEQHLAWWLPAFALALRRKSDQLRNLRDLHELPQSPLGTLGAALAAFIPAERAVLGVAAPTELVSPAVAEPEPDGCAGCEGLASAKQGR
ncbi:MAG: TorD/DmsD family molecular chaperone [Planctomycetota bacterium]